MYLTAPHYQEADYTRGAESVHCQEPFGSATHGHFSFKSQPSCQSSDSLPQHVGSHDFLRCDNEGRQESNKVLCQNIRVESHCVFVQKQI